LSSVRPSRSTQAGVSIEGSDSLIRGHHIELLVSEKRCLCEARLHGRDRREVRSGKLKRFDGLNNLVDSRPALFAITFNDESGAKLTERCGTPPRSRRPICWSLAPIARASLLHFMGLDTIPPTVQTHIRCCDWLAGSTCRTMPLCPFHPMPGALDGQFEVELF
jgi:hypothetical protein